MIRLLRADLYRMFKSGKLYIFIALSVMLSFFMAWIQTYDNGLFGSGLLIEDVQTEYMQNFGESAFEIRGIGNYIIVSGLIIMFLSAIFISVFAGRYFENGTIRNVTVSGNQKGTVFLEVWLLNIISTTLITLSFFISTVAYIFLCGLHPVIWWKYILIMLAIIYLLEITFTSLIVSILFISRKTVAAVIASIVLMLVFLLIPPSVGYSEEVILDYCMIENSTMQFDGKLITGFLTAPHMFDDKEYQQYILRDDRKLTLSEKTWDDLSLRARAGITFMKCTPLPLFIEYNTLELNPYVYVESGMALRNVITGCTWLILSPVVGVLLFRKKDIM